jgi:hypothetical protein
MIQQNKIKYTIKNILELDHVGCGDLANATVHNLRKKNATLWKRHGQTSNQP